MFGAGLQVARRERSPSQDVHQKRSRTDTALTGTYLDLQSTHHDGPQVLHNRMKPLLWVPWSSRYFIVLHHDLWPPVRPSGNQQLNQRTLFPRPFLMSAGSILQGVDVAHALSRCLLPCLLRFLRWRSSIDPHRGSKYPIFQDSGRKSH